MQTYLCVVHPIYQEDEKALQTKKGREKEREREEQGGGQSCYSCFLSYPFFRKKKKQIKSNECADMFRVWLFRIYPGNIDSGDK